MTNPCYFPLPYDGSPLHQESWDKGFALKGRKVTIVDRKGRRVTGVVERVEVSCDESRRFHGVGFMVTQGTGRFATSAYISADFKSLEVHRQPDYIRV